MNDLRIINLEAKIFDLKAENKKLERQALELHKAGSDMYELYEGLRKALEFCRDTAQEVPEISGANRVGKALTKIYNKAHDALLNQVNPCDSCMHYSTDPSEDVCLLEIELPDPGDLCPEYEYDDKGSDKNALDKTS